jgi:hypothetical protein
MPNEIFDNPFQPVDEFPNKYAQTESFMSLSSSDFRLIQRKLDGAEASTARSLEEQAVQFRRKISDLNLEVCDGLRIINSFEKENAALWLENLKLKDEVKQLTASLRECEGPPF